MAIRQRAIHAEAKHERHEAILDAAGRLLLRAPARIASMADVADEAGLAKGTVYLYFSGKEDLLLALHERNVIAFLDALRGVLDGRGPMTIAAALGPVREHVVHSPAFLPLAARCMGLVDDSARHDPAGPCRQRIGERLAQTGSAIERRFPSLRAGDGLALLRATYALVLGLWQTWGGARVQPCGAQGDDADGAFTRDVDLALQALWRGALQREP